MLLYVYIHEHSEATALLTGVQGSVKGQLFCFHCFTLLYLTRSAFKYCLFYLCSDPACQHLWFREVKMNADKGQGRN